MSSSRNREFDLSGVDIPVSSLPPLPDDLVANPAGAWVRPGAWFPRPDQPLHVEIGSGKGTFLVQEAPLAPGVNFLGIEYEFSGIYEYAADRVRRAGLTNVRMLCTDAGDFVHWRLPTASVQVLHLYFPDPWPKTRHHKRRMVSDRFLTDCQRVLSPGGELRVATDHLDYWAWMEAHFARWTGEGRPFDRLPFERPAGAKEGEVVGTNFERKYRREGRTFNATVLRLKAEEPRGA
jgi:tRNA (guanine-N7-)-methyltransferase